MQPVEDNFSGELYFFPASNPAPATGTKLAPRIFLTEAPQNKTGTSRRLFFIMLSL